MKRPPARALPVFLSLPLLALASVGGLAGVEPIPGDWRCASRLRFDVARAEASATLGGTYLPRRVCDGNRKTKWVSPTRPTENAPQWISLELAGGPREVAAVAVFGEGIDNDGVLDADLQAEVEGQLVTLASVRDAKTSSWLAAFEPVKAPKVRLLVSRSAGPTDHTDVWEIEVYGRELSGEEMKAGLAVLLEDARAARDGAAAALAGDTEVPSHLKSTIERLRADLSRLESRLKLWSEMDEKARIHLAAEIQGASLLAGRLRSRMAGAASAARSRQAWFWVARKEAEWLALKTGVNVGVASEAESGRATLASEKLFLDSRESGTWKVAWLDGTPVAIEGIGFSLEEVVGDGKGGAPEASTAPVEDPLGKGLQLKHVWHDGGLRVEREIRVYEKLGCITVGGRIANEGAEDVKLGTARILHSRQDGSWWTGGAWEAPAAVYLANSSTVDSVPFQPFEALGSGEEKAYRASGVLLLASREPAAALLLGHVRADEASPDLSADFKLDRGGVALAATSRFLDRVLGPGESLELNRVYVAAGSDPYQLLESYGDAMAKFSARPPRTGPTALWCSWYAHRMAMTEEKVLANAEVAARHFKPLGMEIIQLDHGWQRGDVTGDWVPNERFLHGLAWLSEELRKRHGLRLGVWISPTDAAETSQVFKEHPEWMLRGDDGKPRVNWRWYWVPNPDCYELDATHPDAYRYIQECFRQLTAWGVSYYKIDFIASSGGEHFRQHDSKSTRGWSVLRRAMEAVRSGAGEDAWIRYCQTPPVLSVGLADSAYGGQDTLDAGIPGRFDVLKDNAHILAAGYWLGDRAYHREVCDMSVRMQGSLEEVRVRAAIMTLANCSISFSDEMCYLPPSRIRLMQQCLPPGNPPMRPVDLFERDIPSIWHIPVRCPAGDWEIIGLFNFNQGPEPRSVRFQDLGLEPEAEHLLFEFWEEKSHGVHKGGFEMSLPPESSRILSIRKLSSAPQLIGTDMHLLQGYHEIKEIRWDAEKKTLSGVFERMPGISARAFYHVPRGYEPRFDFPLSPDSARLTRVEDRVWAREIEFREKEHAWSIPFVKSP